MKRNILSCFSVKRLLPVLLVLGMLLSSFPAYAETSSGTKPEISSESDTQSLHVVSAKQSPGKQKRARPVIGAGGVLQIMCIVRFSGLT